MKNEYCYNNNDNNRTCKHIISNIILKQKIRNFVSVVLLVAGWSVSRLRLRKPVLMRCLIFENPFNPRHTFLCFAYSCLDYAFVCCCSCGDCCFCVSYLCLNCAWRLHVLQHRWHHHRCCLRCRRRRHHHLHQQHHGGCCCAVGASCCHCGRSVACSYCAGDSC